MLALSALWSPWLKLVNKETHKTTSLRNNLIQCFTENNQVHFKMLDLEVNNFHNQCLTCTQEWTWLRVYNSCSRSRLHSKIQQQRAVYLWVWELRLIRKHSKTLMALSTVLAQTNNSCLTCCKKKKEKILIKLHLIKLLYLIQFLKNQMKAKIRSQNLRIQ